MRFLSFFLSIATLLAPVSIQAQPDGNVLAFENCTLEMPGTALSTAARCSSMPVPEDPENADGRQIMLRIALAPAISKQPESDPLFIFAGGPGQAASEAYVVLQSTLGKIRRKRDIVMIDQRGTGQSNPLKCPDEETDLESATDMGQIRAATERCLSGLDGDPRLYTTRIAMGDYDAVRQAMGYEKINLLGISYGTRAAQIYLKYYPGRVRSVVLDSVVPPQLALGSEHARRLDEAVDMVLRACAEDKLCNERYPGIRPMLRSLVAEIRRQPRTISITDPRTGLQDTMTFYSAVLAAAIRVLSYSSETQALLPLLIHEAAVKDDFTRLASQAMIVMGGLRQSISRGMELSVICSEDYPLMEGLEAPRDSLLGSLFLETLRTQCAVWPRGEVPEDFFAPSAADVPVLLLSGERDPVTPPLYAEQAGEQFPNSIALVARGQGHNVVTLACMRDIAREFIESASVAGLDTVCLDNIEAAPFFTSLLGPEP